MKLVRISKAALLPMFGLLVVVSGCQQAPLNVAPLSTVVKVVPAPSPVAGPIFAERRILLTIPFGFDKYAIRPDSIPTVDNLAAALKDERLRGVSYEINGHTDLHGNFAHNIALSALRAKSVSDFLRDRGVQSPPIRAQGFGPLQLLYMTDPFNPGNRRVEIVAIGP
jgi:outer membrane protein OmpA-like peptidoglycan-associated protein